MLTKIYELEDDVSYQELDKKTGLTRVVDVCKKSDGRMALRCYNKQMNSDGEFDAMGLYFDDIFKILRDKGYEVIKK